LYSSDASELVVRLAEVEPSDRVEVGSAYRGRATVYATAVNIASEEHLAELRRAVLQLAERCGFPGSPPTPEFDNGLPLLLGNLMKISAVEAGCTEVWNYLTLVLLPDVAFWRWPNEKRNPSYERLIGKPRNVLRRHWWRWYLLGEELPSRMNEDEL